MFGTKLVQLGAKMILETEIFRQNTKKKSKCVVRIRWHERAP